ncbi:hypothetical protein D3C80_1529680 [compost metagenome]
MIQHLPLIGRQTDQPRQQPEIPGSAQYQQQDKRQQDAKKTEHQSLGEKRRQQDGASCQQSRCKHRLLPATNHQQAQGKGGQHVQGVGMGNEHPVGNFTHRAKQQQPTQIAPLATGRRSPLARQIGRHRQAEPRKRQAPRHIQPIGGIADISQVIEQHAQKRQPLEQIQCPISLL